MADRKVNRGKLALNVALAGLWAGLGILATTLTDAGAEVWVPVILATRALVGLVATALGTTVPVDK
jgi:hypothetical protein